MKTKTKTKATKKPTKIKLKVSLTPKVKSKVKKAVHTNKLNGVKTNMSAIINGILDRCLS